MERKIPQKDHFHKRPIFFGTKDGRFVEVLLHKIQKSEMKCVRSVSAYSLLDRKRSKDFCEELDA
jgi:hypothetical protein